MEMWIEEEVANKNVQLTLIAIGILLLFLLLRKVFITYVYAIVLKISRKSPTELFTYVLTAFEKPLQYIFVIIGLYVAADYFPYMNQSNELFIHLIRYGLVFSISFSLFHFDDIISFLFIYIYIHVLE